jgi:hypothetical protein
MQLAVVLTVFQICKCAADNIIELATAWTRLYELRFAPATLFHALFSAGTVYIILGTHAATGPRIAKGAVQNAYAKAETCVEYLRDAGRTWGSARNIAEILSEKVQEKLGDPALRGQATSQPAESQPPADKMPITDGPSAVAALNDQQLWPELMDTQLPDFTDPPIFIDANFTNCISQANDSFGVIPDMSQLRDGVSGQSNEANVIESLFNTEFGNGGGFQRGVPDRTGPSGSSRTDAERLQQLWDQTFPGWRQFMQGGS